MHIKSIYNRFGKFIAERVDEGPKIVIYAMDGSYIGEYVKEDDSTYDKYGAFVGNGDLTTALIKQF
jgi:hypothetical protein